MLCETMQLLRSMNILDHIKEKTHSILLLIQVKGSYFYTPHNPGS